MDDASLKAFGDELNDLLLRHDAGLISKDMRDVEWQALFDRYLKHLSAKERNVYFRLGTRIAGERDEELRALRLAGVDMSLEMNHALTFYWATRGGAEEPTNPLYAFQSVRTSYAHMLVDEATRGMQRMLPPDALSGLKPDDSEAHTDFVHGTLLRRLGKPLSKNQRALVEDVGPFLSGLVGKGMEIREVLRGLAPVVYLPRFDWRIMLADYATGEEFTEADIPEQGAFFEFRYCNLHLGCLVTPGNKRTVLSWERRGWRRLSTESFTRIGEPYLPSDYFKTPEQVRFFSNVWAFVEAEFEIMNSANFVTIDTTVQPLPVSKRDARKLRNAGKPLPGIAYKTVRLLSSEVRQANAPGEPTGQTVRYHWRRTHWWPRDPHDTRRHKRKGRFVGDISKGQIFKRYVLPVEEPAAITHPNNGTVH